MGQLALIRKNSVKFHNVSMIIPSNREETLTSLGYLRHSADQINFFKREGEKLTNNFGFGPSDPDDPNNPNDSNSNENNLPDFNELFAQLSNFGLNPQTLFAAANSAGSVTGQPAGAVETGPHFWVLSSNFILSFI